MSQKTNVCMAFALMLLMFATIQSGAKNIDIDLTVKKIDMSPEMFQKKHPEIFPINSSEKEYADEPEWRTTYRYVFVPQDNPYSHELKKSDYDQGHPEDALYADSSQKNRFVIFSDSLPDERLFVWHVER